MKVRSQLVREIIDAVAGGVLTKGNPICFSQVKFASYYDDGEDHTRTINNGPKYIISTPAMRKRGYDLKVDTGVCDEKLAGLLSKQEGLKVSAGDVCYVVSLK